MEEYTYIRQGVTLNKGNQEIEIRRQTKLAWAALDRLIYILKNKKIPQQLISKVFFIKTQRALERQMLNVTFKDKKNGIGGYGK